VYLLPSDTLALLQKKMPTLVVPALLLGVSARVWRFHNIWEAHALAFTMGLHVRLGPGCIYLKLEDRIIQQIIELCASRPQGILRKLPGLMRLLGGGLMLP